MYFATSFNSVAIAVYVVTIFEKECLYKLMFHMAKFRTCSSCIMKNVWVLPFDVDTNNFEVDGLHNRYHYWVHPHMKYLKNPTSLLNFFHSTCQWRLSPSISKNGMHHIATRQNLLYKNASWLLMKCVWK